MASAVSGVTSAGLTTSELPIARAGAAFQELSWATPQVEADEPGCGHYPDYARASQLNVSGGDCGCEDHD
jgi:hypothetical protein